MGTEKSFTLVLCNGVIRVGTKVHMASGIHYKLLTSDMVNVGVGYDVNSATDHLASQEDTGGRFELDPKNPG